MMYRVKTTAGYFYTTGNGRYGRVDGKRLYGDVLCEKHARDIVERYGELAPGLEPTLDPFKGHARCRVCEKGYRKHR